MYGSSLFSTLVVYNKYWSRKNRLAPRELNSRPDFFEQPYQFSQLRGLHVPHDLPMEDLNGTIQLIYQIQSGPGQPVRPPPPVFLGPVPRYQAALFQTVHQTGNIRIARHQAASDVLAGSSVFPRPAHIGNR